MKEGASNCVERHLNLNDCDTSLLWTYSQVGHKCCFHSQPITPHRTVKRSRLLEAKLRSKTVSHPPENDGKTWPFPTSDATWEPQACVQHWRFRSDNPLECSG